MYQEIEVKRLSAGSTFKIIAIGLLATLVPFSSIIGLFALFGANTITWNKEQLHGITAFISSPFIGVMIALIFTLFIGSFVAFGLWIYSKWRPLTLLVKRDDPVMGGGS